MSAGPSILLLRLPLEGQPAPVLPAGFSFATFRAADAPDVEALFVAARADGLAGDPGAQRGWFERVRADPMWDADATILVRRVDDGALAAAAHNWSGGFLKDLAVADGFRRRGLAAALVRETARRFRERGLPHLDLKVYAVNAPARHLYEALGFRAVAS